MPFGIDRCIFYHGSDVASIMSQEHSFTLSMPFWYRQSRCSFYYESRDLHFGSKTAPLILNGEL